MIPFTATSELKFVAALVIAGLLFAAGWTVEGWRMEAELSRIKAGQAEAQRAAADENAQVLAGAQAHADILAQRLARTENALNQTAREKDDAIRRLTVGRPCLDSAAVRLLNDAAGLKLSRPVAEAPGEPVPADAAFATDTDVGLWIGEAHRAYDTCRGRLQAIADFYEP